MIVIFLPALIMLIGLLMYALSTPQNSKVQEIGRIMFAFGLLATLILQTDAMVKLITGHVR